MPILPAEPDIYPQDLLNGGLSSQDPAPSWWAIYTLSRREKELMRWLRAKSIRHYGPMIKRRGQSASGRTRVSFIPLFASYVFLCGSEEDRVQALASNCISRCIPVPRPEQLIADLRQIQRLILSDIPLTPEAKLQAGSKVRIRSGSLAGTEGVVIRRRGATHLLVAVSFLQQGASIQLDELQVEPVDS
jgi:transcription antitermination factor NusG